jgi:hypothetical protein
MRSFMVYTAHETVSDQMEKDEMFEGSGMQGEIKNAYTVLVRRTKGERILGRARQKC